MKAIRSLGQPQRSEASPSSRFSDDQIAKVLKFGVSYAASLPLKPTFGLPIDAYRASKDAERHWMRDLCERNEISETSFIEAVERDTFQIPHLDNREGYDEGLEFLYWMTGYEDYLSIVKNAASHGIRVGRFLDFGGSTGRLFRNFIAQSKDWDVWSCDFKQTSVDFNLANFPNAKVFLNSSYPSLPIPDGYFDIIAGLSVFTHINETETSWLLELRRVLKVGGRAYLTIHNDQTWLNPHQWVKDQISSIRPDLVGQPTIPHGKTVISFRDDDPYNCNVFHNDDYIRSNWGRFFEVLSIGSLYLGGPGKQAMVVLRRVD
jgi:SAM-dependent methyltransferase